MLGFEAQVKNTRQMGLTERVLKARSSHTEHSETLSESTVAGHHHTVGKTLILTLSLSASIMGCSSLKAPETKSNIQFSSKGK